MGELGSGESRALIGKIDGVVEALEEREAVDEVHPRAARRPDIRDDQVYAVRLPPNG